VFSDHPEAYEATARYEVTATPLPAAVNARARRTFWLLMGAAAFVLLIACANVANLTLMRSVGREREMFMRAALGAGALRLRRLLLVENLLLALVGGTLGIVVAQGGLRILVRFAEQFSPRASEIRVDGLVLAVGLATGAVVAVLLAFAPRIWNERTLGESAAASNHRSTLGRGRQRLQRSLVVTQIAVSMVLLTGAGLLVRTIGKLQAVETGVRVDHVLTADLPLSGDPAAAISKRSENLARYERIRDAVGALPGVQMSAMAWSVPLGNTKLEFEMRAEGRPVSPDRPTPRAELRSVDQNYFATAGVPLLRGRNFTATDRRGTLLVAIISQSLAKELFGDDDPIGKRLSPTGEVLKFTPFSDTWRTIVGVVGDTREQGVDNAPPPTIYESFAQEMIMGGALVVRTTADPASVQASVVRKIRELYPRQLIQKVATVEALRDETVAPRRLNAIFVASFGGLAFIIAIVGISGVLAFSVSSRTPEIGIRMSLGADASRVRRMVLGEGGSLLLVGVTAGLVGAFFAARLLRTLLFGVTPHDPATLGTAALLLAVVGLVACWIPAERAASVDPAGVLRAE
jgi:predicted permease